MDALKVYRDTLALSKNAEACLQFIARKLLKIERLDPCNIPELDNHTLNCGNVKDALQLAFLAGQRSMK